MQGVFPAQFIRTLAEQPQVFLVVVIMLPVRKGNRVDNKVVMKALRIQVGSDNDLKPFAPHLLS